MGVHGHKLSTPASWLALSGQNVATPVPSKGLSEGCYVSRPPVVGQAGCVALPPHKVTELAKSVPFFVIQSARLLSVDSFSFPFCGF